MLSSARAPGLSRSAPLEARLQSYAPLRPQDLELIRACCEDLKATPAGAGLSSGVQGEHPRLIVSGWAASARNLPDGRRQILQIYLPGDVLGLSSPRMDDAVALTSTTSVDARPLADALQESTEPAHAALRVAWDRAQLARQKQLLDHIVRLGRLSAHERTAHLLLELMDRNRRAGLSDGRRMPWPLTQETLADVLGLSVVHVNRILQQLRREGMIALRAGQLVLPDAERLAQVAALEG